MSKTKIIKIITESLQNGNKLLICGNGGSAAMAEHFAAEFIGKFEKERKPLPAIALTDNSSIVTALGNDYKYETIFDRQLHALAKPGDILVILSTSGNSKNCLNAIKTAQTLGLTTIDIPRKGSSTAHIQEFQLKLIHDIVREVEKAFI